ncbi:YeaH/YhbH family protein [Roseovarius sp. D22-M7]|uniref:YeaH/YhbH family protein n=1 Tax=Roseovarius sp. D22-M7 TaxID=3127116 RepID=UPI00300F9F12
MTIVDRRQNPSGRNFGNRQRFLDRAKSRLRQAVKENIRKRSIEDTTSNERVVIPSDDIQEPVFQRDAATGRRSGVLPGNREYLSGDTIPRPPEGGGGAGSNASEEGEGEDSFAFTLSRDEFLDLLFEDLALPDMLAKKLKAVETTRFRRAGHTTSGPATRLNMVRSLRRSMVRRAALGRPGAAAVEELESELARLESGEIVPADGRDPQTRIDELHAALARARDKRAAVPFLDPIDLRYNRLESRPEPIAQAVMFCLMDVSASMDEDMKGLAKRFFMLLHLFLARHYEQVEVVFIRHTQRAEEVDEQTFFEGRQTGGTIVSTALEEMLRVAAQRYPADEYNIYVAQASDGDNLSRDVEICARLLTEKILPMSQYMAYVEILPQRDRFSLSPRRESDLWRGYAPVAEENPGLAMRRIAEARDIFPVFRDLFRSEGAVE